MMTRRWMRDVPIRWKLIVVTTATTVLSLISACVLVLGYEFHVVRQEMETALVAAADIVGNGSAAAILFSDEKTMAESLAALRMQDEVETAILYDNADRPMTRYPAFLTRPTSKKPSSGA